MRLSAFVLAVLFVSLPMFAAANEEETLCEKAFTNNELQVCSGKSYERADKQLNKSYKKLLTQLNSEQAQKLKADQRNWIIFKEKECQSMYDAEYPGNEAPIVKNACLDILTRDREDELLRINAMISKNTRHDEFIKMLKVFTQIGFEEDNLIQQFNALYSSDKNWQSYVKSSCEFVHMLVEDSSPSFFKNTPTYCSARLNYMRNM